MARGEFSILGEHVYHTGGAILTIDIRAVAACTFLAHVIPVFLTVVRSLSIRMPITLRHFLIFLTPLRSSPLRMVGASKDCLL
jgi:hypothetical protein